MMNSDPVIYVVEDDRSFRKSMERLIRASGFEVLAFDSADAFLKENPIRRPACLILDVQLPGMDGLSLQQKLIEQGMDLPIIFMTGHGNIPMSVSVMKKGAVDFLPKPFESKDLKTAIQRAIERDIQNNEKKMRVSEIQSLVRTLSPREQEILCWVITGKLNKQIAAEVGISEKTVKVHRGHVMKKLKADSLADLVRLCQQAEIAPAV